MNLTPEQEVDRGQRAKRLLEDPLFEESFRAITDHLHRKWAETSLDKSEDREQLYLQLKLLEKLRGTLTFYIQNGRVQVFNLEERRKASERKKGAA